MLSLSHKSGQKRPPEADKQPLLWLPGQTLVRDEALLSNAWLGVDQLAERLNSPPKTGLNRKSWNSPRRPAKRHKVAIWAQWRTS